MTAQILDGRRLARTIQAAIAQDVQRFQQKTGRVPGLSAILVGDSAASQVYVRNKEAACVAAGMKGDVIRLPGHASEPELLATIDRLNADPTVDGILVQLPLPAQISENAVIERVDPRKDVDGFHPDNAGRLAIGVPRFVPCTPLGVRELLIASGVTTRGAHAVVLGRSNIVGKPMALLLLQKGQGGDATVTVCHTGTPNARAIARDADILIVAMGQSQAVTSEWIKPGAVVIDVGIHRGPDGKLRGDVHPSASEVAGWLTPVPGGVGPMTIAMLLRNTLQSAIDHS